MNPTLRKLVAVFLAAWVAAPMVGSEGNGEGNGGVWVLPNPVHLCSGTGMANQTPRLVIDVPNFDKNVNLVLSSQMGAAAATLFDQLSGAPLGLTVVGNRLIIPASMLASLASSAVTHADIVVVDANQLGYRMRLLVNAANSTAQIRVY